MNLNVNDEIKFYELKFIKKKRRAFRKGTIYMNERSLV